MVNDQNMQSILRVRIFTKSVSFDNYWPTCSQRMAAPWQTNHIPETKSVARSVSPAAVASSLLAVKVYGAEQMESPNKYMLCNGWFRDVLHQN